MMKIVTIVGARPQFIKAAAVSRKLRETGEVQEILIHTGQHYDENMSDRFFQELAIPQPEYYLGIGSGSHGVQTGRMLETIESVLQQEKPDWVLIYGDTNSTLAGAIAAVKLHFRLAHVEAGLRSFNKKMPEEVNRVLADHVSEILFAPTDTAVENLRREGIIGDRVQQVGDVMYDAALLYRSKAEQTSQILKQLNLSSQKYLLVTIHRAENTDDPKRLNAIFVGLAKVAEKLTVVVPLHPRTRKALEREGQLDFAKQNLQLIEPVGYLDMVMLEQNARLIATDSGGVQKEAFFYQVPCVTLREETEWVELVQYGWNYLIAPKTAEIVSDGIIDAIATFAHNPPTPVKLYGDGQAATKIVELLLKQTDQ